MRIHSAARAITLALIAVIVSLILTASDADARKGCKRMGGSNWGNRAHGSHCQ